MTIQSNIKTPGIYTDVNINTQRTGLPANTQKVLFITPDPAVAALTSPVDVYAQADADAKFGKDSIMGRMIKAAVKTNRLVDVQGIANKQNTGGTANISCANATGAVLILNPNQGNQIWEVEIVIDGISGVFKNVSGTSLSQIFTTSELYNETNGLLDVYGDSSQTCYILNKSESKIRIRLEPKNSDAQRSVISAMNSNPTLIQSDGAFYFCLESRTVPETGQAQPNT